MIKRFTIKDIRFTFTMARITKVIGVNSELPDGNHILMWDFDNTSIDRVRRALTKVQKQWKLPKIYILETKENENYMAYSFVCYPLLLVANVILSTPYVDWNFIKYGIYRGKFTLRVTEKCGRLPTFIEALPSDVPEDVAPKDLLKWVRYETLKG